MTRIVLKLQKSVEENASIYFEKSKKAKSKLEGAEIALQQTKKKAVKNVPKKTIAPVAVRKPDWYEKFRWFYTSEGDLVIGGRDATTNEIVIKKYTEPTDLVFHTDMAGSGFFVLRSKKPSDTVLKEVATATACHSRAWKLGLAQSEVFYITAEQVSKTAKAGESLSRGSFMIYGKTTYVDHDMKLGIGAYDGKIMCGPLTAIQKHCKNYYIIIQGREKASKVAKLVQQKFGGELDEIIRVLPSGGCSIKR